VVQEDHPEGRTAVGIWWYVAHRRPVNRSFWKLWAPFVAFPVMTTSSNFTEKLHIVVSCHQRKGQILTPLPSGLWRYSSWFTDIHPYLHLIHSLAISFPHCWENISESPGSVCCCFSPMPVGSHLKNDPAITGQSPSSTPHLVFRADTPAPIPIISFCASPIMIWCSLSNDP
jgi:hypothetical protein